MLLTKVGKSDREGTFSGAHGNGEVAPKAAILASLRLPVGVDGAFSRRDPAQKIKEGLQL
jgi:hypothetical protein